eukprot:TRINITY_DN4814_c0_g3_i1.p1 TRINITY_DN4814_c0_g3~~TRINITY_DN4814_c0_g3_i1.p1  ORF type:complete len:451 (+),score=80.86 TRINITY_DN4814_c0_g3_i1:103-1353(+)
MSAPAAAVPVLDVSHARRNDGRRSSRSSRSRQSAPQPRPVASRSYSVPTRHLSSPQPHPRPPPRTRGAKTPRDSAPASARSKSVGAPVAKARFSRPSARATPRMPPPPPNRPSAQGQVSDGDLPALRETLSSTLDGMEKSSKGGEGLIGWEMALLESHRRVKALEAKVLHLQGDAPADEPTTPTPPYETTVTAAVYSASTGEAAAAAAGQHPQPEVEIVRLEAELASALKERAAYRDQVASLSAMVIKERKTGATQRPAKPPPGTTRDSLRRIELEARCATLEREVAELRLERAALIAPETLQMLLLRHNVDGAVQRLMMNDVHDLLYAKSREYAQRLEDAATPPARAPDLMAPRTLQPGPGAAVPQLAQVAALDHVLSVAKQQRAQSTHSGVTFGDVSVVSSHYYGSPMGSPFSR